MKILKNQERRIIMKLSEFKKYIINKCGEKEWENYKSTFGYSIYSSTEEEQEEKVQENGEYIKYINNPSEDIQLEAVRDDAYVLEYIDNPSEEVIIEAIHNTPYAIQYLSNPSEKIQLLAVKRNPLSIINIKNPTEKVIQEAVKGINKSVDSAYLLRHLENDLKEE